MDLKAVFCPASACPARRQIAKANIRTHSRTEHVDEQRL
jgi:hypothetical protein